MCFFIFRNVDMQAGWKTLQRPAVELASKVLNVLLVLHSAGSTRAAFFLILYMELCFF